MWLYLIRTLNKFPHLNLADKCSLHVNCGGTDLTIEDHKRRILYEGDAGSDPVRFLSENHWGFVSSGKFLDGPYSDSSRVVRTMSNITIPDLYTTARLNAMSLTYFHYCLENGSYNVSLHFAEIMFTSDSTYNSLGRRSFDIYIQVCSTYKKRDDLVFFSLIISVSG